MFTGLYCTKWKQSEILGISQTAKTEVVDLGASVGYDTEVRYGRMGFKLHLYYSPAVCFKYYIGHLTSHLNNGDNPCSA